MAVEIILLEDVAGLGKIGEQVRVADGYARNYLFPRQLGQKLSPGLMR
ncbi:MAG: bL9 family ribosomal protein, partial [Lentisphaeria bacterium]